MKHIRLTVDDEVYAALAERSAAELRSVPNTVRVMLTKWALQSKARGESRPPAADWSPEER